MEVFLFLFLRLIIQKDGKTRRKEADREINTQEVMINTVSEVE